MDHQDYKYYFIWITAPSKAFEEKMINSIISKGYIVDPSAASKKILLHREGDPSVIFAFKVARIDYYSTSAAEIYDDIGNALVEMKINAYSVVVADCIDSAWCSANFQKHTVIVEEDKEEKVKKLN